MEWSGITDQCTFFPSKLLHLLTRSMALYLVGYTREFTGHEGEGRTEVPTHGCYVEVVRG